MTTLQHMDQGVSRSQVAIAHQVVALLLLALYGTYDLHLASLGGTVGWLDGTATVLGLVALSRVFPRWMQSNTVGTERLLTGGRERIFFAMVAATSIGAYLINSIDVISSIRVAWFGLLLCALGYLNRFHIVEAESEQLQLGAARREKWPHVDLTNVARMKAFTTFTARLLSVLLWAYLTSISFGLLEDLAPVTGITIDTETDAGFLWLLGGMILLQLMTLVGVRAAYRRIRLGDAKLVGLVAALMIGGGLLGLYTEVRYFDFALGNFTQFASLRDLVVDSGVGWLDATERPGLIVLILAGWVVSNAFWVLTNTQGRVLIRSTAVGWTGTSFAAGAMLVPTLTASPLSDVNELTFGMVLVMVVVAIMTTTWIVRYRELDNEAIALTFNDIKQGLPRRFVSRDVVGFLVLGVQVLAVLATIIAVLTLSSGFMNRRFADNPTFSGTDAVIAIAAAALLSSLGSFLGRVRRRRSAPDVETVRSRFRNPKTVILRSFTDDEIDIAQHGDRLLTPPASDGFQIALASGLWQKRGPVIAASRSYEELPRFGPIKEYLSDSWLRSITERCAGVSTIVLLIGPVENLRRADSGLRQEIDMLFAEGFVTKTVFLFPPVPWIDHYQRWQAFTEIAAMHGLLDWSRQPVAGAVGFVVGRGKSVTYLTSDVHNEHVYAQAVLAGQTW